MMRHPDKDSMERRARPRLVCSLAAFVLPGPIMGSVVDRSETGLRLRFQRELDGRRTLVAVLMASGQAFAANVRWRRENEVGVLITAQCDLNGLVPSGFAEARQVWINLRRSGAREQGAD
jgi:hypothetical protein